MWLQLPHFLADGAYVRALVTPVHLVLLYVVLSNFMKPLHSFRKITTAFICKACRLHK
jgi:hypothetical protein